MKRRMAALASALLMLSARAPASPELFDLPIGDPARRDEHVAVVLDSIADTRRGDTIATRGLAERLRSTRILFIGEDHTNMDFHRVQAQVIRALQADGREILIGLEMFPYTRQAELDAWTAGDVDDIAFLRAAGWYESWGYRWEYYRDIFEFARRNDLKMVGINAPRSVIKAVRAADFADLSPEDARHIPTTIDTSSDGHRRMYRAYFEDDDSLHADVSDEVWEGMYRAQCTWDAVMGHNAMQALAAHGGPTAIIVVLIGAGHVAYGLGAERQIAGRFSGEIASLLPVPVRDADGAPIEAVRASYADFVWGIPPVTEPLYPSLGVSLMGRIGKAPTRVIQVSQDSVAERAGIRVGDVLLSVDGRPIDSIASLRQSMADYAWGDHANVTLSRKNEEITLAVPFRRQ